MWLAGGWEYFGRGVSQDAWNQESWCCQLIKSDTITSNECRSKRRYRFSWDYMSFFNSLLNESTPSQPNSKTSSKQSLKASWNPSPPSINNSINTSPQPPPPENNQPPPPAKKLAKQHMPLCTTRHTSYQIASHSTPLLYHNHHPPPHHSHPWQAHAQPVNIRL